MRETELLPGERVCACGETEYLARVLYQEGNDVWIAFDVRPGDALRYERQELARVR